jgi:hypothetical protein
MMRLCSVVLMLATVAHAALGCCLHHAHASPSTAGRLLEESGCAHCHGCDGGAEEHDRGGETGISSGDRHESPPCHEARCSSVITKRAEAPRTERTTIAFSVSLARQLVAAKSSQTEFDGGWRQPSLHSTPPPLHILYSVLLI